MNKYLIGCLALIISVLCINNEKNHIFHIDDADLPGMGFGAELFVLHRQRGEINHRHRKQGGEPTRHRILHRQIQVEETYHCHQKQDDQ